jgi:MFS family permease
MTFITVRLNTINIPESVIGYIHSAFYGGMLIGAIKSEELINRVGHIRAFASFSSVITITIILQAFYPNPNIWIIFRFFAGFSVAASYVIIESWLLAQSNKNTKGKILSLYMLCLYSSQTASQFFLDIIDIRTLEPFLLAAIISSLAIIPSSVTYMQAPIIETTHKISILKYFNTSPFGFMGCVISWLMLGSIYSFLPNYAQDNNLSVSAVLGITIAGGFCLQWPIGKMSDMFDRAKILTLISLIIILTCILILLVSPDHVWVYIFSFILGGLSFTIYPVSIAQVCDHLEHGNIVNITGALLFAYGVGAILGTPIVALLIENFSSSAIFYYISCISLFL